MTFPNKVKNGPELWSEIHSRVVGVYGPDTIIAGGCVRDYVLAENGIKPRSEYALSAFDTNDVDVFVNVSSELDLEMSLFDLDPVHFISHGIRLDAGERYPTALSNEQQGLVAVSDLLFVKDTGGYNNWGGRNAETYDDPHWWHYSTQIMANPLEEWSGSNLVGRFDHSLCFCWWTPETGIVLEDVFRKTLDTKEITVVNPNARTTSRVEKVMNTYPAFDNRPKEKKTSRKGATNYFFKSRSSSTANTIAFDEAINFDWGRVIDQFAPLQGPAPQGLPDVQE